MCPYVNTLYCLEHYITHPSATAAAVTPTSSSPLYVLMYCAFIP